MTFHDLGKGLGTIFLSHLIGGDYINMAEVLITGKVMVQVYLCFSASFSLFSSI